MDKEKPFKVEVSISLKQIELYECLIKELSNKQFINNAPEKVINKKQEKLSYLSSLYEKERYLEEEKLVMLQVKFLKWERFHNEFSNPTRQQFKDWDKYVEKQITLKDVLEYLPDSLFLYGLNNSIQNL